MHKIKVIHLESSEADIRLDSGVSMCVWDDHCLDSN